MGIAEEPPWPLGAITRWDQDRFLRRTFLQALDHVGAGLEAIVFLGDLLDEGERSLR